MSCADVLRDYEADEFHAASHPYCVICDEEGCGREHPVNCYCGTEPVEAVQLPGMKFPEHVHSTGECREIFDLLGVPDLSRWMVATLFDISGGGALPW